MITAPVNDIEKEKAYNDGRDYNIDNGHMQFFQEISKILTRYSWTMYGYPK